MIKIKKEAIPCFPDFCPHKLILTFLAASSSVIMSAFLKSMLMLMRFFYFHFLMFQWVSGWTRINTCILSSMFNWTSQAFTLLNTKTLPNHLIERAKGKRIGMLRLFLNVIKRFKVQLLSFLKGGKRGESSNHCDNSNLRRKPKG